MNNAIAGVQLDPSQARFIQHVQGYFAPLGVNTALPFKVKDPPKAAAMMRIFVGATNSGGYLQRRGVDWDINLSTGVITWLSTARIALDASTFISIVYTPYGNGLVSGFSYI